MSVTRTTLVLGVALLAAPLAIAGAGFSGMRGGHCGGPGGHHGPPASAEEVADHMNRGLDFMAWKLDATDDQQAQLRKLIDVAAPDAFNLGEEAHALRVAFRDAMENDADRAELEALRLEAVALFDRATATGLDHLVDARDVLTVEQRQELRDLREQFHGFEGK